MADSTAPLLHTCQSCGTLIDIEDQEPLTLVHCPSCGTGQRVRTQFDHFEIQEVLGAGGMGAVYRAWDTTLSRPVALKLLRKEYSQDPEFTAQFQREAAITAGINHPNVVKVYSCGTDHGVLYIAMELVDKGSLDDLMVLQGRVAEMQVLEVGAQIARGLDAALRQGLIHRDIKPGNILFSDAHTAKIVDFGLASLQEHSGKVAGEVWGTPYYVAPEKLENEPREDFRSDLYSLGATMFHALAGRPPFEAETASMVALKHLKSQKVNLQSFAPDISSATAFVINKALSKEPDQRYQSYTELAEHLDYARAELTKKGGISSRNRARVSMENEDDTRAMSWITFTVVALIVAGGVTAWVMRDKLFRPREKASSSAIASRKALPIHEERFTATRAVLVKGDFARAATGFSAFEDEPEVIPSMLNWITVHEALARLLGGDEPTARKAFSRLAAREIKSHSPAERKQEQFFIELGKTLESDKPTSAEAAKDYDKTNYESVAPLLIGLKDWMLGDYEQGGQLLRQFQSTTPEASVAWLADYKPLIAPFLEEITVFRNVAPAMKETDPAKAQAGLASLKTAKDQIKLTAALREQVEAAIARIEKESAAAAEMAKEEQAKKEAEEETQLSAARAKGSALLPQYRFAEARAIIEAAKPTTEKNKKTYDAVMQRIDTLVKFKTQLGQDLATGYTGPAARSNGTPIPAGKIIGNETQLELRSSFGALPIAWTDLSIDTFIAMAKSFIKPTLPPEEAGERQWNLGNFALVMGRIEDAKTALTAAAEAKPDYKAAAAALLPAEKKDDDKK